MVHPLSLFSTFFYSLSPFSPIADNIAEGFERQGNKEFKQFLYIAKGSAGEVRSQLNRAFDVGFVDEATYKQMYNDVCVLSAGILHFIQATNQSSYKGSKYDNLIPSK